MQIMQDVDKYYAAHPDQLQRQVVDVIWNDIAVPNQPSR